MKLIAMAAAIALGGGAALAQNAPAQNAPQQETPAPDTTSQDAAAAAPAPAAAEPAAPVADPVGGYQPTAPALSGTPEPGSQVIVNPSPSPSVAFPPPAPLKSYPVCKKGQFDDCRQRGG
jgi:hypothetical protein